MPLRYLGIRSLALAGCVIGAIGGFWIGHIMLLRTAKLSLTVYAQELTQHADNLMEEVNGIFILLNDPSLVPCSDSDLDKLRANTFHSRSMKDIGRTRDGRLYCSALLGRLRTAYVEESSALEFSDKSKIYTHVALMLAASSGGRGTIIESGHVNMVLSPDTFDHWNRDYVSYMVAAVDRKRVAIAPIAGSQLDVQPAWVLAQGFETVSGRLYRSQCSLRSPLCVVTSERLADIWAHSRAMQIACILLGALAGFGLGLSTTFIYLQSKGLSKQLHRAIHKDSPALRLVYEPILSVHTRHCVGAEALLRWTDESGTVIPPDQFVPIAESKGYITDLTELVIRRATQEVGDILRSDPEWILNINIAAADIHGERLFAVLEMYVQGRGISPGQIALELTERSTADFAVATTAIDRLRSEGYRVDIDDFGTGFSSLSYLGRLNVNSIKIDRSFTRTVGTDAVTASILPQILGMAEAMGLDTIVEGVETEMQCNYLEATGKSPNMQGWYFSKPMTVESLCTFLSNSKRLEEKPISTKNDAVTSDPESLHSMAAYETAGVS